MITARGLTKLLESHRSDAEREMGSGAESAIEARKRFVQSIHEQVGLLTREGDGELVESLDDSGNAVLAKARTSPRDFSLKDLAIGIGGHKFYESFDPSDGPDVTALLEAGPAIDPTHFLNINTFSASVAGLIDATILENFKPANFIGDELFTTRPTKLNGEKVIGVGGFSAAEQDLSRLPGEPHPRLMFGERWVQTPELVEKAAAVEVTQEAVFYDRTGQVLDTAAGVGTRLGYEREKTMLRLFAGITNSYNYKGVAYNTYQASAPWINDQSNPLVDYNDIDDALALFSDMTDPETGMEIDLLDAPVIVHDPRRDSLWHRTLNSIETREVTNTNTTTISTPPPSTNQGYKLLKSTILRNLIDIEGSVTLAQAKDWWFIGNPKRAFSWMEAWPLRTRQASANEYVMLDRGLIAAYFSNYRGVGAVIEPRYIVRNKN